MSLPFETLEAISAAIGQTSGLVFVVVLDGDEPDGAVWWRTVEAGMRSLREVHLLRAGTEAERAVHIYSPVDSESLSVIKGRPTLDEIRSALASAIAEETRRRNAAKRREAADARMLASEDLRVFPSAFQMTRNLAGDAWRAARAAVGGAPVLLPAAEAHARLLVCEPCAEFRDGRCLQCGCHMAVKAHVATSACPLDKWPTRETSAARRKRASR